MFNILYIFRYYARYTDFCTLHLQKNAFFLTKQYQYNYINIHLQIR